MSINTTRGYGSGTKTTTGKSANSDLESLVVSGDADVGGNATIGGNLTVSGTIAGGTYTPTSLTVSGASNLNTLTTTGTTNLASTTASALTVTGATNVAAITASGAATLPSVTGPTTLTGNLTVTGTLTATSISGGSTGDFTVNGRLYVDEATPGNVSTNATISTYNSGSTSNYIQVQTSSTNTGSGEGTLIGVDGRDFIVLQRESTFDILLESENNNGSVRLRGCKLTVRPDSATDGTFSTNATVGTFRNDGAVNYVALQNSTTGTGTGVGTLVGANGAAATLRSLDASGTAVLQTTGGTFVLNNDGTYTGIPNPSLNGFPACQAFSMVNETPTGGDRLHVLASAGSVSYIDDINSPGITLAGYSIFRSGGTGALTLRCNVNGSGSTGADVSLTTSQTNKNGTLSKTIAAGDEWGYQWSSGSVTGVDITLVIYYYIN